MKLARVLIVMLMTLAALPWGGFVMSFAATPHVEQVAAGAKTGAKLSAPSTCRGSFLPGAPCSIDIWLQLARLSLGQDGRALAWLRSQDWVAEGRSLVPVKEPPRLV